MPTTMTPDELLADGALTVEAAVEWSGLSQSELYRLMSNGTLTWFRPKKGRLIPKRALRTYLAELYAAAPEPAKQYKPPKPKRRRFQPDSAQGQEE